MSGNVRKCPVCGVKVYFYGEMCLRCFNRAKIEKLQRKIRTGEEDETYCEEEVICPWCGEVNEFDEACDEQYVEGDYTLKCCECDKSFELTTYVSISYSTRRPEE